MRHTLVDIMVDSQQGMIDLYSAVCSCGWQSLNEDRLPDAARRWSEHVRLNPETEYPSLSFCGEIMYDTAEGMVHSDICLGCEGRAPRTLKEEDRQFYHDCLDEWLNNSKGTGAFYLGSVWNYIDGDASTTTSREAK